MLTEADAFRVGGLITVVLIGQLPTPCDEVEELVHYPANGMGSAQIFLREGRKPGLENMYCTQGLGRIWSMNSEIRDQYSKTVEIFINDQFVRKIRVIEITYEGWHNIH
ncbi:hypothetical protein QF028_002931 [Neobacillus sp. B4I6]|jgi:hypothetical protein|uniref:Uncharacterized protein n=1 Tax=Priestia megaterium TaxID=1404 RepID=A0A6H1P5B2_PRIMG|nr:hypothetical protein [Priestia megaterium]QIZ08708.1 hypothetical protein HFZ78_20035 [Priestia megaterium]